MFKATLEKNFKAIFGFKKVTFNAPSEQFEQDTMFVEIQDVQVAVGSGKERAKVMGTITTFSQDNKLPYGFINKRVAGADKELTKDLFFFDTEQDVATSPAGTLNISERRSRFLFLYSKQFDPQQGEMTEFEMED